MGKILNIFYIKSQIHQSILKKMKVLFKKNNSFSFLNVLAFVFEILNFLTSNFQIIVEHLNDIKELEKCLVLSNSFKILLKSIEENKKNLCKKPRDVIVLENKLNFANHLLNLYHMLAKKSYDDFENIRKHLNPSAFNIKTIEAFLKITDDFSSTEIESIEFQKINQFIFDKFLIILMVKSKARENIERNRKIMKDIFRNFDNNGYFYKSLVRKDMKSKNELYKTFLFYSMDSKDKKFRKSLMVGLADEFFNIYKQSDSKKVEENFLQREDLLRDLKVRVILLIIPRKRIN